MKIFVVAGCCLYENTSANLCHRAYIDGMISLGHTVDLLSFSKNNTNIDESILLPNIRYHYEYDGVSLYEKLAKKRNDSGFDSSLNISDSVDHVSFRKKFFGIVVDKAKRIFRSTYGIYNPSIVWYNNTKKYSAKEEYDLIISLSYPQVSHLVAKRLIEKKKIVARRWIQLWEDPWTLDLNNSDSTKKSYKAEKKLLDAAEEIIYVSPITLNKQRELFEENRGKMKWFPLPSYYKTDLQTYSYSINHYGYFGDYSTNIRNLLPFYNTAVEMGIVTNICGSSDSPFVNKSNVSVYPRMPLNKLKKFEDYTNVLICLFNLKGGQIPGKIYQYASTNKIVLVILDGTDEEKKVLKEYFSKYNRFVFCNNDEKSIRSAITNIEKRNLYGVLNEPLTCFSPQNIVNQIIERNDVS